MDINCNINQRKGNPTLKERVKETRTEKIISVQNETFASQDRREHYFDCITGSSKTFQFSSSKSIDCNYSVKRKIHVNKMQQSSSTIISITVLVVLLVLYSFRNGKSFVFGQIKLLMLIVSTIKLTLVDQFLVLI